MATSLLSLAMDTPLDPALTMIGVLEMICLLTVITENLDTLHVRPLERCCLRHPEAQSAQPSPSPSTAQYRL